MSYRIVLLSCLVWVSPAQADLYRWVDPDSGSVKFSSYPPPWYGDAEREKHAPQVEHIPALKPPTAGPAPAAGPAANGLPAPAAGASLEALEARRKALLQQLSGASMQKEQQSGGAALKTQIETFASVNAEMDRLDPRGADGRRTQAQPVLEKLVNDLRTQAPASR